VIKQVVSAKYLDELAKRSNKVQVEEKIKELN